MKEKIIEFTSKDDGFTKKNGLKITDLTNEHCIMEYKIKKDGLNPFGIVHGGILFGLADTCAGTLSVMNGKMPLTTSGNINYLNKATGVKLIAEATILKEGNKIGYYNVDIYNDEKVLVAQANINMYFSDNK